MLMLMSFSIDLFKWLNPLNSRDHQKSFRIIQPDSSPLSFMELAILPITDGSWLGSSWLSSWFFSSCTTATNHGIDTVNMEMLPSRWQWCPVVLRAVNDSVIVIIARVTSRESRTGSHFKKTTESGMATFNPVQDVNCGLQQWHFRQKPATWPGHLFKRRTRLKIG